MKLYVLEILFRGQWEVEGSYATEKFAQQVAEGFEKSRVTKHEVGP